MKRWVILGLAVAVLVLLYQMGSEPVSPISESGPSDDACVPFAELESAAVYAEELGRSEEWVLANYRVNLWSMSNEQGKGVVVGEVIPGSRLRILDETGSSFRVRSPLDGSVGWIGGVQVNGVVLQDPQTNEICSSEGSPAVIQCPDGTTYIGNRPEEACR